jgi:hypothetical protein
MRLRAQITRTNGMMMKSGFMKVSGVSSGL